MDRNFFNSRDSAAEFGLHDHRSVSVPPPPAFGSVLRRTLLGACTVEVLMLGDWRAAAGEVGLWPECGHLARPTLGWKSQTGRPERKRFAFHTRSMGTARPGASALAGQHLPQHVATVPIRLLFNAKHTRSHSPHTFAKPGRLNRRNPSASLIHPFGASESHLRCPRGSPVSHPCGAWEGAGPGRPPPGTCLRAPALRARRCRDLPVPTDPARCSSPHRPVPPQARPQTSR